MRRKGEIQASPLSRREGRGEHSKKGRWAWIAPREKQTDLSKKRKKEETVLYKGGKNQLSNS